MEYGERIEAGFGNAVIKLDHVSKTYHSKKKDFTALKEINIEVLNNEFVCIVGPSGCGKSTLLRMIAGLEEISCGEILMKSEAIKGPGAERGMVFQNYTLFPWLTVAQNIAFGLTLSKQPKDVIEDKVDKYLKIIDLEKFRNSYPKELSGGMKQRVAIARALANSPEVLLMDEPFGALDPYTKASMQLLVRQIWEDEKTTIIFITHDIDEAIFLADRMYILSANPGEVRAEVPIYLSRRRTLDLKDTQDFIRMRQILSGVMQGNRDVGAIAEIYA
ncbi:MAG: ABC transporter ATP-binding protein [Lachnospiraceae bacterium]|nr:ABC transporter ATP-binding protein [Lachnospiraceae bacterium]